MRYAEGDSLSAKKDTSGKKDSLWVVYLDSTARMQEWVHHRVDSAAVVLFPPDNYPLYAPLRSTVYRRDFRIDSLGENVVVREEVDGIDVKIPVVVPFQEYLARRIRLERRNSWKQLAHEYKARDTRDELGNLLSSFTNISIPMPTNPLMSIFGGRSINLSVSGAVDIRAAFRNQSSDQVGLTTFDQSQSTPDFNQDVQINVSGTIGDKLKILADWNTQRTFEFENQLHINYQGYDDEIVQSVEAGNVSLQTPSLVSGGQALFGIKAKLQTGPLTLTTILSQKKGQAQQLSLSGGSQATNNDIHAYSYSQHYYFVDSVHQTYFEPLHQSYPPTITSDIQDNQIVQMDLWQTVAIAPANTGTYVNRRAYVNLPSHPSGAGYDGHVTDNLDTSRSLGHYEEGYWIRLDPSKDYKYDPYGGYVYINNFSDAYAYAVSYTVLGPLGPGGKRQSYVYGDTIPGGEGVLKLIKPKFLSDHPEYQPAWGLMLKNIYNLGGRNVSPKDFKLQIVRRTDGPEITAVLGYQLLNVLGLDRFDANNSPQPRGDGAFDFIPGLTIDLDKGDLIFPTLRPFDNGLRNFLAAVGDSVNDSLLFREVYDTTQNAASTITIKDKYIIRVHASQGVTNTYSLGFNVVEGSVQVLLDGTPLTPNVDYTVDYILGQVTIRNQQALAPGRNLQVKYEQNDLFQLASKTMVGARGELNNILPNTNLGFTFMNLNQATLSDKVRVGEEPTDNSMFGFDGSTGFDLPFLTSAINAIPFLKTREMSNFHISGEGAYILPNANTKTSTIASDNGATVAYIDDFEGSQKTIPLSLIYSSWHLASPPITVPITGIVPQSIIPDSLFAKHDTATIRTFLKSRFTWFNNSQCFDPVVVTDIYGNRKQVRTGQEFVSVLELQFDPNHRGVYNFSPDLKATLHRAGSASDDAEQRRNNWGGMMQYLPNTGNLLDQNMAYIEIWMRTTGKSAADLRHGKLNIDIGRVSEGVIPGPLYSEDIIKVPDNTTGLPTGVLHPGQDLGLDMLANSDPSAADDERRHYADFLSRNAGDPDVNTADPSGDDWIYSACSADVSHIDGTEGNSKGPSGNRPDTEDLNGNSVVDNDNEYLEYQVPLDSLYYDSTSHLIQNPYIVGRGDNGWIQIHVPLISAAQVIGTTSLREDVLKDVQYIRLWMNGLSDSATVRISDLNFVGNQWQTRIPNDSVLKPSVVSIEDNPDYADAEYLSLGITRPRDLTDPNQIIYGNEQSLSLVITGLQRGDSHHLFRSFETRPLDIFNYKELKMFVHGDPKFNYYAPDRYDAEVFIRFGSDTLNYYEYRTPIHHGWHPDNQIDIILSRLTSIKAARDSTNQDYRIPANDKGATFAIKGNPSLRQIREIMIGITNPAAQGGTIPLTGQVWVNELRLLNVNNDQGFAYHFDSQVKVADLGTVAVNYSHTDPNFHGLSDNFGSQNTTTAWAVNTNVSLDKFFPQEWSGTSVGVGYSHSVSKVDPKYLPNSDVLMTEATSRLLEKGTPASIAEANTIVDESQTYQVNDSYSVPNFHINLPTQLWYIRDTFNKLQLSFQYNTARYHDPTVADRLNWQWSFGARYGVQLPSDIAIQPFKSLFKGIIILDDFKDWKLYIFPFQNLNAGLTGQRSRAFELDRNNLNLPTDTRSFGATKSVGFSWKLTEGGLLNLSGDYNLAIDRSLYNLDNDSVGRGFGTILRNLLIGGRDGHYNQRVTVNSRPKIINILDLPKFVDLSASYNVNYGWQNTFANTDLSKSSGFDNAIAVNLNVRLRSLTEQWFSFLNEPKSTGGNAAGEQRQQLEQRPPVEQAIPTDERHGRGRMHNEQQQGEQPQNNTPPQGNNPPPPGNNPPPGNQPPAPGTQPPTPGNQPPTPDNQQPAPGNLQQGQTPPQGNLPQPQSNSRPDTANAAPPPGAAVPGKDQAPPGNSRTPAGENQPVTVQTPQVAQNNVPAPGLTPPGKDTVTAPAGGKQVPAPKPQGDGRQVADVKADTGAKKSSKPNINLGNILSGAKTFIRSAIKVPFFEYDVVSINFNQTNRVGSGGILGSTGFLNFWDRSPFQGSTVENGPSRLYQLGLISDPAGTMTTSIKSTFPFINFDVQPGLRAPNAAITDQFTQSNTLALKTNRQLWPGASIEINWKVGWQYSRNTALVTDSLGSVVAPQTVVTTGGSVERSFLSLPPVLFFKVFKSDLEDVGKKYDEYSQEMPQQEALTQAFEKGMEALPIFDRFFGEYMPRPNWSIRWDGIEKIAGLNSIFDKLSLEHAYTASFRRDFRGDPATGEQTDVERVTYGFSPLASVNMGFKEFLKGTLSGSIRFNSTESYDLNVAALNIVETFSQEISLSLSYGRKGFRFPLFGLNLSNDIDFSVTYSLTKNSRTSYDPTLLSQSADGTPLEGSTRTLIEPHITYDLSTRVRASVFYRYQKTAPDQGASLIYGTTTNEAGLDIHITI